MGGFSLIELLVSMAIGLSVTLAISSVLIRGEGAKRSSTSVNDLNQNGAFLGYALDRAVRNAGSGLTQRWNDSYGCRIGAALNGPGAAATIPAPTADSSFSNFTFPVRLAPIVIAQGAAKPVTGGDVLMVMSGAAGAAETAQRADSVSVGGFTLQNAVGMQNRSMVLLANAALLAPGGASVGCVVQELGTVPTTPGSVAIPFNGPYQATSGQPPFTADTIALPLGTEGLNPPNFNLYGVDADNALRSYDLLTAGGAETPVADGVVEMRALYGVDTTLPEPDGVLDSWVDPSGDYSAATLLDGSDTSRARLRRIVAVRIGLILRTALPERATDFQGSGDLTLFPDATDAAGLSLKKTRTITGAAATYRYRLVDFTVPLRNVLLSPPI